MSPGGRTVLAIVSRVQRILTSKRAAASLSVGILSSLGNLGLSVATAHRSDITGLGEFGLAFSIYVLTVGLARSAVADPALALAGSFSVLRDCLQRASLIGLISVIPILSAGLLFGLPFLIVLALTVHGAVLYEYVKTMSVASFSARHAITMESVWLTCSLAATFLVFERVLSPVGGFAVWAGSSAVVGYVSALILKLNARPRWRLQTTSSKSALGFGLDFLIGSGSGQLALNIVSATAGLAVLGALRGAGTVLGPVTLMVTASRALLIPHLSRIILRSRVVSPMHNSAVTAVTLGAVVAPFLFALCFLPDYVGRLLLGANWDYAQPLLPALAIELFFIVTAAVPFAGHRAILAARESLVARGMLGAVRVCAIVWAAVEFGALGAAIAMACTAFISAVVWWVSYGLLLRRPSSE